jgi:hypothetical protein
MDGEMIISPATETNSLRQTHTDNVPDASTDQINPGGTILATNADLQRLLIK